MMSTERKIFLLPHQIAFLKSKAMHTAIVGGYGSGKTEGGIYKIFAFMLEHQADAAYYLPTYSLVEDVALKKMPIVLKRLGIEFIIRKKPYNITLSNGTTVMLRSMDNPDMIAGYEVGYSIIDEIDRMPKQKAEKCFYSITARNRIYIKNVTNSVDFVCTPEGYNFLYDFFVKNKSANRILIKAKTIDNPFLPPNYIEQLRETYPEQFLKSYLDGEFVNLTSGAVYSNYSHELNNTNREVQPNDILHVGMDFNITKMSAVIHVTENEKKYAVSEIANAYDTDSTSQILKSKYPNNKIIIYPDASGQSRVTSGKSDIDILKGYGFQVRVNTKNGFVRDRVNAMNIAFLNKNLERNYLVNYNNCPEYSDALKQIAYKSGAPSKESGHDHITDAGGYFIVNQPKIISGSSSF